MDTSTALLARLFARPEGGGRMLASVPIGMVELAHRLSIGPVYGDKLGLSAKGRVTFVIEPGTWEVMTDVRAVSHAALRGDRVALSEVLCRVAVSGFETNALLREEWDYLVRHVGEGAWQRGIPYIG